MKTNFFEINNIYFVDIDLNDFLYYRYWTRNSVIVYCQNKTVMTFF